MGIESTKVPHHLDVVSESQPQPSPNQHPIEDQQLPVDIPNVSVKGPDQQLPNEEHQVSVDVPNVSVRNLLKKPLQYWDIYETLHFHWLSTLALFDIGFRHWLSTLAFSEACPNALPFFSISEKTKFMQPLISLEAIILSYKVACWNAQPCRVAVTKTISSSLFSPNKSIV